MGFMEIQASAAGSPRPRTDMALHQEGKQSGNRRPRGIRHPRQVCLACGFPQGGRWRRDLTEAEVRFLAVYSHLIVYRPETEPLQIVAILHAHRDVAKILPKRV